MNILLECPRCLNVRVWNRSRDTEPGYCFCKTHQHWRVIKERPPRGHVIVMSSKGKQELFGPSWQEHPGRWVP